MQAAAAEIEYVGELAAVLRPKYVRVEGVDDASALLLVPHHPGVGQDAEVVRHVDEGRLQQFREGANGLGPALEALDHSEAVGIGQRFQALGTRGGLETVVHRILLRGQAPARRQAPA
jgi:hypothetical protein